MRFSKRGAVRMLGVFTLMFSARPLFAQHAGHAMPMPAPDMMMTGPLGISTDRQGSGTSWVPEAVLMSFRHTVIGRWDVMSHWNVFGQYITQSHRRGRDQFGSINWSMVMASRPFAGGRLQLRAMNSVEAATVGRCGYPHLLQTGETCHGQFNVDRQHPHDFFMETAALYERALTDDLAWSAYVAASGEPALGPVAFMHRPSAMNDPLSNIGHHWQDATHIMFGVASAALYGRRWKLEGSVFNGREPDEHRWNFDLDLSNMNSHSGRITVNPDSQWSVSASYGRIIGENPTFPRARTERASASVLNGRQWGGRHLATAVVWGANRHEGADHWEHSALAEADFRLDAKNTLFGRLERVRKSDEELVVDEPGLPHVHTDAGHALTSLGLGYVRELGSVGVLGVGAGARGTVSWVPESLRAPYGTRTPMGLVVFLRARAKPMSAEELARMHERMMHAGMKM
jgi:hypothetical protein